MSAIVGGRVRGGAVVPNDNGNLWNKASQRQLSLSLGAGFTIFCGVCIIWFKRLSAFMSWFICLQLQVDVPANLSASDLTWVDSKWYRLGWTDLATVLSYTVITLIATTSLEDFVLVKMLKKPDGTELCKTHELSRLIVNLAFNVLTVSHAAVSVVYGHFEWWNLWNGYENSHMPFVCKMFFMSQVAFWLHAAVYNSEFKHEQAAPLPNNIKIGFHLSFLSLAFVFKNSIIPTIVWCMIIHALVDMIDNVGEICRRTVPDNEVLNICLNAVYKYLNIMESAWLLIVSLVMANKGETNLLALRLVTVIGSLGWIIFVILWCLYENYEDGNQPNRLMGRADAGRAAPRRNSPRRNSPMRRQPGRVCRQR